MEDDAWGDLFAKASDMSASQSPLPTADDNEVHLTNSQQDKEGNSQQPKSRKRKRRQRHNPNTNVSSSDDSFQEFLSNRMIVTTTDLCDTPWPSWFQLGESLCGSKECRAWKASSSWKKCAAGCNKSALYHCIQLVDRSWDREQKATSWPMHGFVALRNLRCCASLSIDDGNDDHGSCVTLQSTKAILTGSSLLSSLKPFLWKHLPEPEARILESKLSDVIRQATLLSNTIQQKNTTKKKKDSNKNVRTPLNYYFEKAIRLIMACDAMFYRLYYLQLVNLLPIMQHEGSRCFLPHPTDYFGLPFLTMDLVKGTRHFKKLLTESMKCINVTDLEKNDMNWQDEQQMSIHAPERKGHPLLVLYQLRRYETATHFYGSGWTCTINTRQQILASMNHQNHPLVDDDESSNHEETPAPSILMEWRDSCRDFLCNLYAYATISENSMERIVQYVKSTANLSRVIEMGAGTGYVAKLLQDRGISITAWDIDPPGTRSSSSSTTEQGENALNEYHGHTPAFCSVKQSPKLPLGEYHETALLLCYPPPDSSMAFNALSTYLQNGGKHLIHIGEFKGLTGNTKFERLLIREMICPVGQRMANPSWGTDASHVTLWVKQETTTSTTDKQKKQNELLLPCSNCNGKEAIKRCRLLRSLVYCSQACFDNHVDIRTAKLRLQMIHLDGNVLDWNNPCHLSGLGS